MKDWQIKILELTEKQSIMKYTIEYKGQTLDVSGNYHEAQIGDYETQSISEEFEILKIKLGNYNITELIGDETEEIERLVLEEIN